jgi:hypothetical protein
MHDNALVYCSKLSAWHVVAIDVDQLAQWSVELSGINMNHHAVILVML